MSDISSERESKDNITSLVASSINPPAFKKKKTITQKKSVIFSAIKKVNQMAENINGNELIELNDHTDDLLDEQGRRIRWRRIFDP